MTEINKVRLYGAGGHSQIIQAILIKKGTIITAIYDDNPSASHALSKNIISANRNDIDNFPFDGDPFIIAVGDNLNRYEIFNFLKSEFTTALHSSSILEPSSKIGKGTVVYAGAVIQTNSIIGNHVIINTLASVDHDTIIGDFAHISPNATICGLVEIGEGTHIGAGAVVIPKMKIGKWCVIGAGAVIIRDIPDYSIVVGNPGEIIRKNNIKKVP